MRLHRLRFDIWLCLLVAYLVSLGTGAAASALSAATYDGYAEVHSAAPGQAGSPAGPEVPRAQSIAELLELDTFTVLSQGIAYRNEGAGYFEGSYLYNLALPSGERVAARIHTESVQDGENFASGQVVLPVGRVIWADLEEDPAFLEQITSGLSPGPHRLLRGHGRRSGTLQSGGADGKSCYSGSIGYRSGLLPTAPCPGLPQRDFPRFLSLRAEGKGGAELTRPAGNLFPVPSSK